ncbi:MAG TPA: DUF6526 family protein [Candidatus Saccharimonadales bacterium]|nr:DUF6526 family protein [Candidatus Saccharimonadales bacterium]
MSGQSFSNHAKFVPAFHYFALPVLTLNFVWSVYRWRHAHFSLDGLVSVLTASAILVSLFLTRIFALRVQDRVIRLEERLRFAQILPPDLQPRVQEFTPGQLVALRFAGDAELPDLARKVLDERITSVRAIKGMIQDWRPDYLRA